MHFVGLCLQTGGNGIEAHLKFLQHADELVRRELCIGIIQEDVDNLTSPQPVGQILFPIGCEQFTKRSRCRGLLINSSEEFFIRRGYGVGLNQCGANISGRTVWILD